MPATGQASDWLSPIIPSRFSQDSHLDPRSFRGTACSWGEVSIMGAERCTEPSSFPPNVGQYTGDVRTRCVAAAGSIVEGAHHNSAN